eukprot:scaffold15739_cov120-Isochrysis_galbana.AAC.1
MLRRCPRLASRSRPRACRLPRLGARLEPPVVAGGLGPAGRLGRQQILFGESSELGGHVVGVGAGGRALIRLFHHTINACTCKRIPRGGCAAPKTELAGRRRRPGTTYQVPLHRRRKSVHVALAGHGVVAPAGCRHEGAAHHGLGLQGGKGRVGGIFRLPLRGVEMRVSAACSAPQDVVQRHCPAHGAAVPSLPRPRRRRRRAEEVLLHARGGEAAGGLLPRPSTRKCLLVITHAPAR